MSWNLARGEAFLPRVSLEELKRRVAVEKGAKPRVRLLIALQRKQGKSIDEISEATQLHRTAVQKILHRFVERGVTACHAVKQAGRPKRMSEKQLLDLRKRLLCTPRESGFDRGFWSSKLVVSEEKVQGFVQAQERHKLITRLGFFLQETQANEPAESSSRGDCGV